MSDTRRAVWGPRVAVVVFALAGWLIAALHVAFANMPVADFPRDPIPTRPAARPYRWPPDPQWMDWVVQYCDETGVPVWLACRLFYYESGFNAGAVHYNETSVDVGIAQLNSACLKAFEAYNNGAPVDPRDPETSIRVGIRYLAALYAELGNWKASTCAYNVGIAGWRAGMRPLGHMRGVWGE